jgi:hypothetical protein
MLVDTALGHISVLQAKLSGTALLQFVLVAVVAYNLLWLIYTSLISSLRKIPGPFLARISRVWEIKEAATGNLHETIMHLHQRHGKSMASG